ncbi:hypothetical protein I6F14_10480 [Bradyrhizobium sp. IC3069]|nr:hypothetical protein [Bradyrhizobium sp. IC3069]
MDSVVNPLQLSRFIRVYDDAAANKGIRLSIGFDFHDYVSITRSLPTKTPTYPIFRPDRSPIEKGKGYWLIGLDKHNEVALAEAARLYDLSHTNFAELLESLKMFYADPATHAHPQDRCICTAPSARKITGKMAYHGDVWVRPEFRGQGMLKIMTGILRGVTLALWAPDYVCGLAGRWSLDKSVYGAMHHEPGGAMLHLVEEDIVAEDWLLWTTGEELRNLLLASHDRSDRTVES